MTLHVILFLLQSFFGRTYNNVANIAECKNGGRCVINKKNRTSCKDCRLRKCLSVGMSKSGSRYGRRSNWFKIHCLLQDSNNQGLTMAASNSSFGPNFLPALIPPPQIQPDSVAYSKDRKTPPSHEDLTHILQVAMLRQQRERRRSPQSDDAFRHNMYYSWQKRRSYGRPPPPPRSPSSLRDGTPSPFDNQRLTTASPTTAFPVNIMNAARGLSDQEYISVLHEVERTERYRRYGDTISESGSAADGSCDGDAESRSNTDRNYSKTSPALPEQESSSRKPVNATLTLTAAYQHGNVGHGLSLVYPPPGLVTPAASQNSPLAGGDLLLVSPSPGGLAVEQNEPIDLSVRTSKSSSPGKQLSEEKDSDEADSERSTCNGNSSKEEEEAAPATRNTPLDLTLTVKRSTEVL